jgi:hypothetical protein
MRIVIIALLMGMCTLILQAQEKTIGAPEFEAAERAANELFANKTVPAKWTIVTENRREGWPQTDWRSRTVMEFGPDRSSRRATESSFGGDPQKKEYAITVGGRKFERSGDGGWSETTGGANVKLPGAEPENTTLHVEYKYLGNGVLNGKNVRMYIKTEGRTINAGSDGALSKVEASTRYWFGENGDFYRMEYTSTTVTDGKVMHTNVTIEKEPDPQISITAPVASK